MPRQEPSPSAFEFFFWSRARGASECVLDLGSSKPKPRGYTLRAGVGASLAGNLLCLGASRMLHTSRIMRRDLRMLLQFMVGRCLVWLTMGTLVTSGVLFLEREFSYTASGG